MDHRGLVLTALAWTLASACASDGSVGPPSLVPLTSELHNAPQQTTLAGVTLQLETYLWRDYQPVAPPDGEPLIAVLPVKSVDGATIPVARPGLTDSCYHYRPATVSLTGRLIRRTLPGPPNYQSIARGDRPQVVDLLILETPICTIPDYMDSPNTDAFQGQDTIQVRRAESTWRDAGRLTGRRVVVAGTPAESL